MKQNEYNAAEAIELGKAEEIILGRKVEEPFLDSTGADPIDRLYVE